MFFHCYCFAELHSGSDTSKIAMSDTESSPSSSLGSASGNGSNHSSPSSPQSPLGFQITTEPFFTTSWRPKHGKNIRDGRYITQLHMEPYSYTKDMPKPSMGENVWRFKCNRCRKPGRGATYAYGRIVGTEKNGDPIWKFLKAGRPHTCSPPDFHVFMNKVLLSKYVY